MVNQMSTRNSCLPIVTLQLWVTWTLSIKRGHKIHCCCHVWAELLLGYAGQAKKTTIRTVCPTIAASLKHLTHCWNADSLNLFICITLVDLPLKWINWFYFLFLLRSPLVILIGCIKNIWVNSSFPSTARLRSYLPAKCFFWLTVKVSLSLELIGSC